MRKPHSLAGLEKLLLKRRIILDSGCWIWTGCISKSGYGKIRWGKKDYRVHRIALFLWKGFDLEDDRILGLHNCKNRACFNPEHLRAGNQSENVVQSYVEGRIRIAGKRGKLA